LACGAHCGVNHASDGLRSRETAVRNASRTQGNPRCSSEWDTLRWIKE
jgi:hypothetical protein